MSKLHPNTIKGVKAAFKAANSCGDGFTGGGQALARIILSAYNGANLMSSYDFCALDTNNYENACDVIHARWQGFEPHQVYQGAEADMEALKRKYAHLLKQD